MATPKGGYDCDFVNNPPKSLECTICLLTLRDPHVISCCGNHFCRPCVERVQRDRKPCPLCNDPNFTVFLHKGVMREINALLVRCPQKELGCGWEGELGKLQRHVDPGAGLNDSGCGFVKVGCVYECGGRFLRGEIHVHELDACPRRPVEAVMASIVKRLDALTVENQEIKAENQQLKREVVQLKDGLATKAEVTQLKDGLATKAEVTQLKDGLATKAEVTQLKDGLALSKAEVTQLKDGLATKAEVAQLKDGLATKAEVTRIKDGLATKAEVTRIKDGLATKAEVTRIKDGLATKAEVTRIKDGLATKAEVTRIKDGLATKAEVTRIKDGLAMKAEVTRLSDATAKELKLCAKRMDVGAKYLSLDMRLTPTPPFNFTMCNYEHFKSVDYVWHSEPFYTHHGGYKLLMQLFTNGSGSGKGTHLSVFVCIMRGENDDILQWPFRGRVTVQAYNRGTEEWDNDYVVRFDNSPESYCKQPLADSLSNPGWGVAKYLAKNDIKCYASEGVIRFRVYKVELL